MIVSFGIFSGFTNFSKVLLHDRFEKYVKINAMTLAVNAMTLAAVDTNANNCDGFNIDVGTGGTPNSRAACINIRAIRLTPKRPIKYNRAS